MPYPARLAAALALTAAACTLASAPHALASPVPLAPAPAPWKIGSAPRLPVGARMLGPLAGTTAVQATVTLQPRDPAALAAFAHDVSTPGSAVYHQYLSVAQFAQRFGPAAADIDLARASLAAAGLDPGPTAGDHLSIPVRASAASLAAAFSTSFASYRLPDGSTAYANRVAPSLPSVEDGVVQGVLGLDTLAHRSPAVTPQIAPGAARPCTAASSAAARTGGYTADQFASAYGMSSLYAAGDLGAGATVALFELEPYTPADVTAYQSCYQTNAPVSKIAVDGGATGSQQGEAALDIEVVAGLAPAAAIKVYSGPNSANGAYHTFSRIVSDNTAQVISTSWGLCEADLGLSEATSESTLFQEAAAQGQSVLAASGDRGADDCNSGAAGVDDPASQPDVTGVGGTTLRSGAETVWGGSQGAGGGGVSTFWPAPTYQAPFAVAQTATTCGAGGHACREVPDVSAAADPATGYPIYYGGAWVTYGGTSAAAPLWASLLALADTSPTCHGTRIGLANPLLYGAAGTAYASSFHDISSGSNSFGGVTGFSASAGYDMASGLGSPSSVSLASSLCGGPSVSSAPVTSTTSSTTTTVATPAAPTPTPTTSPPTAQPPGLPTIALRAPAAQRGRVGVAQRLRASATDSGGLTLRYTASRLPPGLRIDPVSGLISGTPTRAGVWAPTLIVSDSRGASAHRTFRWTIAGLPAVRGGSLRLDRFGHPILTLTIVPGSHAPAVSRLTVGAPRTRLRFNARPPTLGISALTSGRPVQTRSRVLHGALVITLRRPSSRSATVRVVAPRVSLGPRRGTSLRLAIVITDARGRRTRLVRRISAA